MKMRIILKSGAVIDTRVSEYTVGKNRITEEIESLKWTLKNGKSGESLKYLRLEEVAAVVTVRNWRGR